MLTTDSSAGGTPSGHGPRHAPGLTPAGRLCAFVLLAVLLFAAAWQVGHDLGPIGASRARSVIAPRGEGGGMKMGALNERLLWRAETAR
jgi:hypothetical protein